VLLFADDRCFRSWCCCGNGYYYYYYDTVAAAAVVWRTMTHRRWWSLVKLRVCVCVCQYGGVKEWQGMMDRPLRMVEYQKEVRTNSVLP
jgi:hypothetical protein